MLLLRVGILCRYWYGRAASALGPALLPVYWFCFLMSVVLCAVWTVHLPTAGKAIGALGAVGVIVALRGEKLPSTHRLPWAFITLLLLVMEVRAIDNDRAEQNRAHASDIAALNKQHEDTIDTIVHSSSSQMAQNQEHFDQTLDQMQGLASSGQKAIDLSNEAIGQITGKDTWLQITPVRLGGEPLSHFFVTVHGKYAFYGKFVEVYDSSGLHYRRRTFPFPAPASLIATATLETYYPQLSYPLALSVPVTSERAQMFEFRMFGRTGIVQEWLSLYRSGDTWSTAMEIHRGKELLAKWKDPRFPEDWKLEPPTEPLDPKLSRTAEY